MPTGNPVVFRPDTHDITVPEPLRKTVDAVHEAGWHRLGMPAGMDGTAAPTW